MQNHWLGKIDKKDTKFNKKFLAEAKQLEIKWEEHAAAGLWDWQQNAYAIYLEAERLKNEKK